LECGLEVLIAEVGLGVRAPAVDQERRPRVETAGGAGSAGSEPEDTIVPLGRAERDGRTVAGPHVGGGHGDVEVRQTAREPRQRVEEGPHAREEGRLSGGHEPRIVDYEQHVNLAAGPPAAAYPARPANAGLRAARVNAVAARSGRATAPEHDEDDRHAGHVDATEEMLRHLTLVSAADPLCYTARRRWPTSSRASG
jgi:hypothetical protein